MEKMNTSTTGGFNDITAAQLVSAIKIGWNLGNTFDSMGNGETSWGNPKTTKALITAIGNVGFNAIRIPVTWTVAGRTNEKNEIDSGWMNRVKEVVDYAVDNDMYIIINTHHDDRKFRITNAEAQAGREAFKKIWQQIAFTYRDYNEKLIFEALNEPRNGDKDWDGTQEHYDNINAYMQDFVDTVRAGGGNNNKRILMVTPYWASTWGAKMAALKLPNDTVEDKLVVSVHCYEPSSFAMNTDWADWSVDNASDREAVDNRIQDTYKAWGTKAPIIMGEFGAMNKNNLDSRVQWTKYYVKAASDKGIKMFWWDNGASKPRGEDDISGGERFGIINRTTNELIFPEIVQAMKEGAGITQS